jgi:hypothetical protein
MDRKPLKCEVCGAILDVPHGVHGVHCPQCRAAFKVRHHEGQTHLELVVPTSEGAGSLSHSTKILHLQSRLAQLDHEWAHFVSRRRSHRKLDAKQFDPSNGFVLILSFAFVAVGGLLIYWGMQVPNAKAAAVIGGLIVAGSILFGYWKVRTVNRYRSERKKYHQAKADLVEEIRSLEMP